MLKMYDAPRCPFCARVRLVLDEKGIECERVEVSLPDRPAWLIELNPPEGRVPVLIVDDGTMLPESWALMEYLEERFPEPALMPAEATARALVRASVERQESFRSAYYGVRRNPTGEARERLSAELTGLNGILADQPYLAGADYTLADIALVPWLARAEVQLSVELDEYPELSAWIDRLAERPAVAAELGLVRSL